MAYSELVKNFNRIRDYMREFYIYGFKSREEYTKKSARSYDDERRRLESWLGDYMRFRQTSDGKKVFLSVDSRVSRHNPLYKAWKTKSFTDGDITMHFFLFDILSKPEISLSLNEIADQMDTYCAQFSEPRLFDLSTVRKKLKEYVTAGMLVTEKRGKTVYYRRADEAAATDPDMLDFFSEISPCGVVGSFLLDKLEPHEEHIAFKHHYITGALDSEVLCAVFMAMREKRSVILESIHRHMDWLLRNPVVPLRVMISVQSGRQYVMAYVPGFRRMAAFRTDQIVSVKLKEVSERFDELRAKLDGMQPHMWGVSTQSRCGERMEHVEFTVCYSEDEPYIPRRLEREKRCGTVEHFENHTSRFSADVFDASELVPWIRTFICRIRDISFSDKELEAEFKNDIKEMYALYGLEGGEKDAVQ